MPGGRNIGLVVQIILRSMRCARAAKRWPLELAPLRKVRPAGLADAPDAIKSKESVGNLPGCSKSVSQVACMRNACIDRRLQSFLEKPQHLLSRALLTAAVKTAVRDPTIPPSASLYTRKSTTPAKTKTRGALVTGTYADTTIRLFDTALRALGRKHVLLKFGSAQQRVFPRCWTSCPRPAWEKVNRGLWGRTQAARCRQCGACVVFECRSIPHADGF